MKSSTIVKPPVASRMASAIRAEPATTPRRNQCGSVPVAIDPPPRGETRSAGSKAADGFSSGGGLVIGELLLDVRPRDDQAGDHVDDEGDPEENEARGDQGVDVDT